MVVEVMFIFLVTLFNFGTAHLDWSFYLVIALSHGSDYWFLVLCGWKPIIFKLLDTPNFFKLSGCRSLNILLNWILELKWLSRKFAIQSSDGEILFLFLNFWFSLFFQNFILYRQLMIVIGWCGCSVYLSRLIRFFRPKCATFMMVSTDLLSCSCHFYIFFIEFLWGFILLVRLFMFRETLIEPTGS